MWQLIFSKGSYTILHPQPSSSNVTLALSSTDGICVPFPQI